MVLEEEGKNLFADHMTDHVGNLTESTKKATRNHIGEFSKDLKLSEKVMFCIALNGQLGIKIWRAITFTRALKKYEILMNKFNEMCKTCTLQSTKHC